MLFLEYVVKVDFDHAACLAKFVDRTALGVGDRVVEVLVPLLG